MNAVEEYRYLADWGIAAGVLTADEARTIARVGHRKQPYWARHVRDLRDVLRDRVREKLATDRRPVVTVLAAELGAGDGGPV